MYYKNRQFNIPNNLFFTRDLLSCNLAFSRARVLQILKQKVLNNEVIKIKNGIYALNTTKNTSKLTNTTFDIVKNKYITNNNSIYGFISGIYLLNMFGLTTQVPNTLEITTNKESTRGRYITYGNKKYYIKRSKFNINIANVKVLQLISVISAINVLDYQEKLSLLKQYIKENKISRKVIFPYIDNLNKTAIKNLCYLEVL